MKPNFVFIMTDTQGANMVGCYGRPELRTTCLDQLASEGIRFSRAYTSQPVCTAARAGIFTGCYPHATGAWGNHLALGDTMKTMGQRFQSAGYNTAYTGKWHLSGHDYFDTGICPDGWDPEYWFDGRCYINELADEEISSWRSNFGGYEGLKKHGVTAEFTWGHRVSNRGVDFLRKQQNVDKPFVLVVSYDEPHGPSTCPPEYIEPFLDYEHDVGPNAFDNLANKPDHHREWAAACPARVPSGKHIMPNYFGCNSFIDNEIGRVIDAVKEYTPENTWIIYTSDHGDPFCSHGMNTKGPTMYEEITHIPLIIRKPEGTDQGQVDNALVSHLDLLPGMLELAGLDIPPFLDGRSIAPRLIGQYDGSEREIMIEFNRYEVDHDFTGFQPIRCWMSGDYKLVINLLSDKDELYNLKDDPAEMDNLIDNPKHTEIRNRMHASLLDEIYDCRDPFRGPQWERRPWCSARRFGWTGKFRPRPDDGFAPDILDYRTGKVAGFRCNGI
ncbi:MAG: sulfatase-like hydrolase/transferase [Victivallaceae bacterium]|nr:sulfatase-like hydrolase/transferase [Victivallaceae bacterium]